MAASQEVGRGHVTITTDDAPMRRGLNNARTALTGWAQAVGTGILQGVGQQLFRSVTGAIGAAIGEIGKATRAASDLAETVSKVSVVFGDSSQDILKWSEDSATAFGLSQRAALEASASLGNMFIQMGEGRAASATLSKQMVELAADIASFNNVGGGAEAVLQDMQSAFRGEFDPIQKYIPMINAATVQQQALAESGKESADALTFLDKALATQTLIFEQAGVAAGDFERTINNVANQERILASQLENARASIGQAFTPIYATILRGLNQLIQQVTPYGTNLIRTFATGMVNGIIYLLPVIRTLRDIFTYWMRPGSPPRFLPDIDKWGAGAMRAYLEGMSNVDFGILSGLGDALEQLLRSFVGSGQIRETDLVSRVFGTQAAILRAINEWRTAGSISASTLRAITETAGPAGDAVEGLVRAYFDLQNASRKAAEAQRELTDVTTRYDKLLSPIQDSLDALSRQQADLRDAQRGDELREILDNPLSNWSDRQQAQLELQRIELERQQRAIEAERDVAVDAAQQKLDAARKEEKAKQDVLEQQQSIVEQQVRTNNLIAEEIALRERLANEALAEQKRLMAELEAEQRKAEAADKERLAELERIYQATLQYNLATTDTEGKIALMRLELGRHAKGSVEYYNILTQIAGLEQQLAREREKGTGGALLSIDSILPSVESMDVPSWAKDLADKLDRAMQNEFGTRRDFGVSIAKGSSLMERMIGPESDKLPAVSNDVKNFVDALKELTTAVVAVTPPLTALGDAFSDSADKADEAGKKTKTKTASWLEQTTNEIKFWTAVFNGDWGEAWARFVEHVENARGDSVDIIGQLLAAFAQWTLDVAAALTTGVVKWTNAIEQWFTDQSDAFDAWLEKISSKISSFDLSESAATFLGSMWEGLKDKWEDIADWWSEKMDWILDQIPTLPDWLGGGSPSFDTPSLQSGGSLGRSFASSLTPTAPMPLAAGAPTTNVTHGNVNITQQFHGPTDADGVRRANEDLLRELRSRGIGGN